MPLCSAFRRRLRRIPLYFALLLPLAAPAQMLDATRLNQPALLEQPWRVQAGDTPAWAQAGFDDSQWPLFDPHTSLVDFLHGERPAIVWYRLRIRVSPDQTGLALREQSVAPAYEIYGNGELLLASGSVRPYRASSLGARRLVPIPARMLSSGWLVLALRVGFAPGDWTTNNPGLYSTNLALGQQEVLERDNWLSILGENALPWLNDLLELCLGIAALVLFFAQRSQREYIWIVAMAALTFIRLPYQIATLFEEVPLHYTLLSGASMVFVPMVMAGLYFSFAGIHIRRPARLLLILVGILNGINSMEGLLFSFSTQWLLVLSLPYLVLLAIVLPLVLARALRRGNHEAGILLIPVLLLSLYVYVKVFLLTIFQIPNLRAAALAGIGVVDRLQVGPFTVAFTAVGGILSNLALAIILLLRSSRSAHRQALLEGELAAAQQVQQLLLPGQGQPVPGFTVESVYEPARQVGGDFFQVLCLPDGGLLVVVGDVSGKGLPAAMMVSVLVGAIRTAAEFTQDPAELLAHLNRRMVGRSAGHFATALALHIWPEGRVEVANAGHLAPYLDGRELELAGALPLGIAAPMGYETASFELGPGSRLTLLSDGVVEARSPQGELFGFDRTREISLDSAESIVRCAQRFGQEDDITVLAIRREALTTA